MAFTTDFPWFQASLLPAFRTLSTVCRKWSVAQTTVQYSRFERCLRKASILWHLFLKLRSTEPSNVNTMDPIFYQPLMSCCCFLHTGGISRKLLFQHQLKVLALQWLNRGGQCPSFGRTEKTVDGAYELRIFFPICSATDSRLTCRCWIKRWKD